MGDDIYSAWVDECNDSFEDDSVDYQDYQDYEDDDDAYVGEDSNDHYSPDSD